MLSLLTNKYIVGVAIVALALSGSYYMGWKNSRASMIAKAQKELAEQLQERGMTDAEIAGMSDSDKCELIGGVWIDGECQ